MKCQILFSDNTLVKFSYFPENRIGHFMHIVSIGDNLHEMSNPVFWEKYEKYFNKSYAENITPSAER